MTEDTTQVSDNIAKAKKAYTTPLLIVHGDIEKITQGAEGGDQDMDLSGNSIGGNV